MFVDKYNDPFQVLTTLISDYNLTVSALQVLWLSETCGLESKSDLPGCTEIISGNTGEMLPQKAST